VKSRDAAFIAACSVDVPALTAEVEALREALVEALAVNLAVSQGLDAINGLAEGFSEPFKSGLLTATEEMEYRIEHVNEVARPDVFESQIDRGPRPGGEGVSHDYTGVRR